MPFKDPHSLAARLSATKRLHKYRNANREKINQRERERRKTDPLYRSKRIEHVKQYQLRNRGEYLLRKKAIHLKTLYGLSMEDYLRMADNQQGVCAICCKGNKGKRKLAVDHCHKSGKIRALLCDKCNRALGYLNDDVNLLLKAIEYLKFHA